jgi:hypothetical protein
VITDEQRQAVTGLALKALDTIENEEEDATLGDAIIVFEVVYDDGSSAGNWHATNVRTSVNLGLLHLTAAAMTQPEREES